MLKKITSKRILFLIITAILLLSVSTPAFAVFDPVSTGAAFVINATTGEILYEYEADTPRVPASTTKMLTSLLVIEAVERGEVALDDMVLITEDVIETVPYDASVMYIPLADGEYMSLYDLLYANMLSSDCMASNVLGAYISGSVEDFVVLMNSRAAELGCTDTVFTNPSGYPDDNMHTTARSLYFIASECMKHELFREIVSTKAYTIPSTNLSDARTIYNGNRLLHEPEIDKETGETTNPYYYEYAAGIKTGYCSAAGYCLVSCSSKNGNDIYVVILGGEKQYTDEENYVLTQYTETLRAYEYFYAVLSNRVILENSFEEGTQAVIASGTAAVEIWNGAFADEEEVVAAFREKQAEAEHKKEAFFIVTLSVVLAFIIIISAVISVNRKSKKETVTK